MEDLWTRHASVIKILYQVDRKRLKDVKQTLETQYGFPSYPLSTYESKLRDVLKLRKKLKRGDWSKIYFYAQSRNYGKEYDTYLNGTLIPWKKAWREVRRSGALAMEAMVVRDEDLPQDVMVLPRLEAVNPPTSHSQARVHQSEPPLHLTPLSPHVFDRSTDNQSELQQPGGVMPLTASPSYLDRRHSQPQSCVSHVHILHEALPWNKFRRTVLAFLDNGQPVVYEMEVDGMLMTHMPQDSFFPAVYDALLTRFSHTIYPSAQTLLERLTPSACSSRQRFWYQHLAILIYIISNRLDVSPFEDQNLFGPLSAVLRQLPPDVVMKLFQSQLISVRALWDNFVSCYAAEKVHLTLRNDGRLELSHFESFEEAEEVGVGNLLDIIASTHPEWIEGHKHALLSLAARIGRSDLIRSLLGMAACVLHSSSSYLPPIVGATLAGAFDAVRVLISSCGANELFQISVCQRQEDDSGKDYDDSLVTTIFVDFLLNVWVWRDDPKFVITLQIFLDRGANVYTEYPVSLCGLARAYGSYDIRPDWYPTCLDVAFYRCSSLFSIMRRHSVGNPGSLRRYEVCEAVLKGHAAIDHHLQARAPFTATEKHRFLELVLLDQFYVQRHPRGANLTQQGAKIARTLLDYGVELRCFSSDSDTLSYLLEAWMKSVNEYETSEDYETILGYIVRENPNPTSDVLKACVQEVGVQLLTILQTCTVVADEELAVLGAPALLEACRRGNFEAVNWLIRVGVDINAEATSFWGGKATVLSCYLQGFASNWMVSTAMFGHLIHLGAAFRHRIADKDCTFLIMTILRSMLSSSRHDLRDMVMFLRLVQDEIRALTCEKWYNIFQCTWASVTLQQAMKRRREFAGLFEYLYHNHLDTQQGSVLALAIQTCMPLEFIQKLVACGMDEVTGSPLCAAIQTNSLDIAHWMLQRKIAHNHHRPTTLSRCMLHLKTMKEVHRACPVVHFGDTNWLARRRAKERNQVDPVRLSIYNETRIVKSTNNTTYYALHFCATEGDVRSASLLLEHRADPNLLHISWYLHDQSWIRGQTIPGGDPVLRTALDMAVYSDKIDMVQLLLKAGGLSATPGTTGYDGALRVAKPGGAVYELIHRHILDLKRHQDSVLRHRHQALINQVLRAGEHAVHTHQRRGTLHG